MTPRATCVNHCHVNSLACGGYEPANSKHKGRLTSRLPKVTFLRISKVSFHQRTQTSGSGRISFADGHKGFSVHVQCPLTFPQKYSFFFWTVLERQEVKDWDGSPPTSYGSEAPKEKKSKGLRAGTEPFTNTSGAVERPTGVLFSMVSLTH